MGKHTRAGSLLPRPRDEDYTQWLQSFEGNEGVPALLDQMAGGGVDVERILTLLYVAPMLVCIRSRRDLDEFDKNLAAAECHLNKAADLLKPFPFPPRYHKRLLAMLGCVRTQVEEHRRLFAEWRSAFTTVQ